MFMQIKALKRNVQKQYSNLSFKEKKNWDKCTLYASFDNKTVDLIISYLHDATVNSYESVICKESILLIYKF